MQVVASSVDCLVGVKCGAALFQMLIVLFRLSESQTHEILLIIVLFLHGHCNKIPPT